MTEAEGLPDPRACNTGVTPPLLSPLLTHCDWYAASVQAPWLDLTAALTEALPTLILREDGRPHNGFTKCYEWIDAAASSVDNEQVVLRCMWGGRQIDPWVEATGSSAPALVALLADLPWTHRVSRFDSALDICAPGAWDHGLALAQRVLDDSEARGRRVTSETQGDWLYCLRGRTLYMGGRKSAARVRLYEKGHEQRAHGNPDADLNWIRFELQYRPDKRADKAAAAALTSDDIWGVREWTRDLWAAINGGELIDKVLHTKRPPSTLGGRADALTRQYGPTLADLHDALGSDGLHEWIDDVVARVQRDRAQRERDGRR